MYDKLNEHLQSNDQIATEGVWDRYMVVSRLVVDRRRRRVRNRNDDDILIQNSVNDDVVLQGRGKIESYHDKLGLFEVNVESHCLGHSVLISMSLNDKGVLYRAFMAGFDRYLKVVIQDQLIEIENSCQILSQIEGFKKYSMRKLQENYLEEKISVLWFTHKRRELKGFISMQKKSNVMLFHNDNHFDVVQNPGLFLFGRKANFCSRCFEKVNDANNHVCYDCVNCFKCKQTHPVNSSFEGHTICPLCGCVFDNQFCLNSHYRVVGGGSQRF